MNILSLVCQNLFLLVLEEEILCFLHKQSTCTCTHILPEVALFQQLLQLERLRSFHHLLEFQSLLALQLKGFVSLVQWQTSCQAFLCWQLCHLGIHQENLAWLESF